MLDLLLLWLLVEVMGVLCLPLTFTLFHNLPDRGWSFSKILGIVVVAFCIWLPLMCFPLLPYSRWFIACVFGVLSSGACVALWRTRRRIYSFLRENRAYIAVVEGVFTGMMILLGVLRSYNPAIQGFEMYMDEGFVAAIMRSPHFPPQDMWMSGYSINYYYYAHYTIATLAKLLGQSPSIAFNTGICLFFGLTAVNLFGTACNIIAWSRRYQRRGLPVAEEAGKAAAAKHSQWMTSDLCTSVPFGLLCVAMSLIMGNLAATQQWWQAHGNAGYHFNWFTPSRVIANTINEFPAFSFLLSCFHAHVLTMAFTIFCIALALNWLLAGDVQGLALFGHGWHLPVNQGLTALILGGLFTMNSWDYPTYSALVLVCIALQQGFACRAARGSLWHWSFPANVALIAGCVIPLSYLLYLPFYLHFDSPSQGIGIVNVAYRSSLSDEFLIYGLFAFIFLSFLLLSAFGVLRRSFYRMKDPGVSTSSSHEVAAVTPSGSWSMPADVVRAQTDAHLKRVVRPDDSANIALQRLRSVLASTRRESVAVAVQEEKLHTGATDVSTSDDSAVSGTLQKTLSRFSVRWREHITRAGLLGTWLAVLLGLVLYRLWPADATLILCSELALLGAVLLFYHIADRAYAFILLCGVVAFIVIAGCEVFFLRDVLANGGNQRMNTVFKFYFQSWSLLSLASATALYHIWHFFRSLRSDVAWGRWCQRGAMVLWSLCLLLLMGAAMTYPLLAPYERLAHGDSTHPQPYLSTHFSLDGMDYLASCTVPFCDFSTEGDYKAIRWLNENVAGDPVIVEALGEDYRYNSRVSTFTGLPTPMGWIGHETQWRINWLNQPKSDHWSLFNQRISDIEQIYCNPSSEVVLELMKKYHAQYLYVGPYEYKKYAAYHLERFSNFMQVVYNSDGVSIYKVVGV